MDTLVKYNDSKRTLVSCSPQIQGRYDIKEGTLSIEPSAFKNCINLESITLPRSLHKIGFAAFSGCNKLKSIYYTGTLHDWLTSFDEMFLMPVSYQLWTKEGDTFQPLRSITIPEDITEIREAAFNNCDISLIGSIKLHPQVTRIGSFAFSSCRCSQTETRLDIPDSVTYIGGFAFSNNNYEEICIPSSIITIGQGAFTHGKRLSKILVDSRNKHYSTSEDNKMLYNLDKTKLHLCCPGNIYDSKSRIIRNSCIEIDPFAFDGCHGIKILLPEGLKSKFSHNRDCIYQIPYGKRKYFEALGYPTGCIEELFDKKYLLKDNDSKTLDIISNNPFRVLGLYTNCSTKDIASNVSKLKRFATVSANIVYDNDFSNFFGPVNRSLENIELSAARLQLAKDRLMYGLFWFSNLNEVDQQILTQDYTDIISARKYIFDELRKGNFTISSCLGMYLTGKPEDVSIFIKNCLYLLDQDNLLQQYSEGIVGTHTDREKESLIKIFIDTLLQECNALHLYYAIRESSCKIALKYTRNIVLKELTASIKEAIIQHPYIETMKTEDILSSVRTLISKTEETVQNLKSLYLSVDDNETLVLDELAKHISHLDIALYNKAEDASEVINEACKIAEYAEHLSTGKTTKEFCTKTKNDLKEILIKNTTPVSCLDIDKKIKEFFDSLSESKNISSLNDKLNEFAGLIRAVKTIQEQYTSQSIEEIHISAYIQNVSTAIAACFINQTISFLNSYMKDHREYKHERDYDFYASVSWIFSGVESLDLEEKFRSERLNPAYESFMKLFPKGRFPAEAMTLSWKIPLRLKTEKETYILAQTDLTYCKAYINHYPEGKYIKEVKDIYDDLTWKARKNIDDCKKYLSTFPEGKHAKDANQSLKSYDSFMGNLKSWKKSDIERQVRNGHNNLILAEALDDTYFNRSKSKHELKMYMELFGENGKHYYSAKHEKDKDYNEHCVVLGILFTGLIGSIVGGIWFDDVGGGLLIGLGCNLLIPICAVPAALFSYIINRD